MPEPVRIGDATLYLGDCLDVLPALRSDSVDLILADPPYGNNNHGDDLNKRLNDHRGLENRPITNDNADAMRRVVDGALMHAARLLKREASACCFFCGGGGPRPVFAWLADRMDRGGLTFFHAVVWDKLNPGLGWRYRQRYELVLVAHRRGGRLAWRDDALAIANVVAKFPPRDRAHPNEKPVDLVGLFIDAHTRPGDIVVDPFMGSGTTGVACARLDRKFIGIEIEPEYFEIACRRIEDAYRQRDLFVAPPSTPAPQQRTMKI